MTSYSSLLKIAWRSREHCRMIASLLLAWKSSSGSGGSGWSSFHRARQSLANLRASFLWRFRSFSRRRRKFSKCLRRRSWWANCLSGSSKASGIKTLHWWADKRPPSAVALSMRSRTDACCSTCSSVKRPSPGTSKGFVFSTHSRNDEWCLSRGMLLGCWAVNVGVLTLSLKR